MFKAIALLKAKEGLSQEEFVSYYETRHVPLILASTRHLRDYRRNYLNLRGPLIFPERALPGFDVITELWFDDRAGYEAAMADFGRPGIAERIAQDEENFCARDQTQFFVVDERITTPGAPEIRSLQP